MTRAKILVVDDNLDNRTIIGDALEASGFDVCQAVDGLEALEAAAREKPALILLDLSIPKLDGWEVARRLKNDPALSHITIFAFTAHAMPGDDQKARAAGCDDYVSKPCVPREVIDKIRLSLEGKERMPHA